MIDQECRNSTSDLHKADKFYDAANKILCKTCACNAGMDNSFKDVMQITNYGSMIASSISHRKVANKAKTSVMVYSLISQIWFQVLTITRNGV